MTLTLTERQRVTRIFTAYKGALGGRDPASVDIRELLPAVFAAVPDTSEPEIAAVLRWAGRQALREADALESWWRQQQSTR
jgi:hypothetical protein